MVNQLFLHECFEYSNGALIWKERPVHHFKSKRGFNSFNTQFAGKIAGRCNCRGYWQVGLSGHRLLNHRVIWMMFHGDIPQDYEIDHVNHVKGDNRIENLRLVTHMENGKNQSAGKNNKSGFNGVLKSKEGNRWRAFISVNRKKIHLGSFLTKQAAIQARKSAEIKYGYHANHGGQV
ncbi:HNH endonuclease [Citrobacter sp. wls714]|uniref:HNH endonuclease n=1 Tax=Citrobacter sp. wls714 TaxID=2576422 RepID=UPI0010C9CE11|nr:HNH endonuclease [Citrobacter sp. wls714]TKU44556.1 HNH endonuclease [Citrobacter sp. wls714]